MLKKYRAVFAKAERELRAEGFFDELAETLHLSPKKSVRNKTAKKPVKKITGQSGRAAVKRAAASAGR
jgi:hypothetical protein